MKWQNHQIATGFIVYAATNDALMVAASILGAVLPDRLEGNPPQESKAYWKWRKSHRTWSHYPPLYFLLLALAQVGKMYFQNPILEIILNLVSYIFVGALLHIAEDGICGKVPILSTKKKHGLKLFKVGSWGEYVCTGLIVCGCIAFSFSSVIDEEYNISERFSQIEQIKNINTETTFERLKKILGVF